MRASTISTSNVATLMYLGENRGESMETGRCGFVRVGMNGRFECVYTGSSEGR